MIEIWKPVKGYEGYYEVSDFGNVRSLDKYIKCRGGNLRLLKGRIISLCKDKDGYLIFNLIKDKVRKNCKVHRLVAENFIDNPKNKPQVNHKNGIKSDNRLENLEWCLPVENMKHAVKNGFYKSGKEHHNFGSKSKRSRIILNLENGVFFDCLKDASINYNFTDSYLSRMLNGYVENKTNLKYV